MFGIILLQNWLTIAMFAILISVSVMVIIEETKGKGIINTILYTLGLVSVLSLWPLLHIYTAIPIINDNNLLFIIALFTTYFALVSAGTELMDKATK